MTSPFKEIAEFEKELTSFANKFRTAIADHSKHISSYFEMSYYNMVIRYYEKKGYSPTVENLIAGRFRFKCSPTGHLENFSYIKLIKDDNSYRLYHNASVRSAYDNDIYTTPDIVVAKDAKPSVTTDYYKTRQKFTYLPNSNMVTFCEAKHFVPFPELMISFIGTVNELKPSCLQSGDEEYSGENHIAPSLMMSGGFSKPTEKIADSLQRRYFVNMLDDLFIDPYKTTFSSWGVQNLATLNSKRVLEERYE